MAKRNNISKYCDAIQFINPLQSNIQQYEMIQKQEILLTGRLQVFYDGQGFMFMDSTKRDMKIVLFYNMGTVCISPLALGVFASKNQIPLY